MSVQELSTTHGMVFSCSVTDTASNRISSGGQGRLEED